MSVLENLRNLGAEAVSRNLETFKIKSTGDFEQDIVNLKDFYFENLETLYNNLPLEAYEFLEIALGDYCEDDYKEKFENLLCVLEELGLSSTTTSDLTDKHMYVLNKYVGKTNHFPPFSKEIQEDFKQFTIQHGLDPDEKVGEGYFKDLDKEIGTALFNFLNENKEIRENEKFNLKLIEGTLKVHNYLSLEETFKIFDELKINCNLNELTTLVNSKFIYTYEENNTVFLFHKNNRDNVCGDGTIEYVPLTKIHSLETYLQA